MSRTGLKIVNLVLCAVFLLFATLQFNDPDPVRWISVYGFVALACGFAALGKSNKALNWVGIGVIAAWMATLFPEILNWIKLGSPNIAVHMKAETPYIEFTREFFGLMLAGLALGWLVYQPKNR